MQKKSVTKAIFEFSFKLRLCQKCHLTTDVMRMSFVHERESLKGSVE